MTGDKLKVFRPKSYTGAYCGRVAGINVGWRTERHEAHIYLCSFCRKPTFFDGDTQIPGAVYGNDVEHLPPEIEALYREARNCMATPAYTAAVLLCRKLLMNIAVAEGASFVSYVQHLADQGYVPPKARGWIDHIRRKGNEANHEIQLMERKDAEELIMFVEMLLKLRVRVSQPRATACSIA